MGDGRVVIVCGGRDYANRAALFAELDWEHGRKPIALLRHGAARGADALAAEWAAARGIPTDPVPAMWEEHGRAAGPMRNTHMLQRGPAATHCIAFRGGAGTCDMADKALRAGLTVSYPGDWREVDLG